MQKKTVYCPQAWKVSGIESKETQQRHYGKIDDKNIHRKLIWILVRKSIENPNAGRNEMKNRSTSVII